MPQSAFPRCFLSASFEPADRQIFGWFEKLLDALDFEVVTGADPEPRPPIEVIRGRIESCPALVGILTRRDRVQGTNRWKAPRSVGDEIAMAYAGGKTLTILVEDGVDHEGLVPEATTYVTWNRENLAASTPRIVRYLLNLRAKLAPGGQFEGDVPTARALALELSNAATNLEQVGGTLTLSQWHFAGMASIISGKLLTFPRELVADVQEAYDGISRVASVLSKIDDAREKLRPKLKPFQFPEFSKPPPALPEGDRLWTELRAEKDRALVIVRRAVLRLVRFGWSSEWKANFPEIRAAVGPEKFKETFGVAPDELD